MEPVEDRGCCGKFVIAFPSAIAIALLLLVDVGTDYGDQGPGSVQAMFDSTLAITVAIIYIMALVLYPFLPRWSASITSVVAVSAAVYTVGGVFTSTAFLGIIAGMIGVLYLAPAGLLVVWSIAEIVTEISARRRA